jgi:hypothetical protein
MFDLSRNKHGNEKPSFWRHRGVKGERHIASGYYHFEKQQTCERGGSFAREQGL